MTLTACGGGGDAPVEEPTAGAFDATNYAQSADPVARAVLSAVDAGGLPLDLVGGIADARAQALAATTRLASPRGPLALLRRLAAPHGDPSRAHALATVPFQEACAGGGTLAGQIDDADNDGELSAGDSATLVATNCVFDTTLTLHGGVTLRIDAYTYRAAPYRETATIAVDFDNLTGAGVRMDGVATLSADFTDLRTSYAVAYDGTTLADATRTLTLGYRAEFAIDNTAGDGTLSFNGAVVLDGHRLTLVQREAFHLRAADQRPDAGTLEVGEAKGARLHLVAAADRFGYRYFAPGNAGATPDASSAGLPIRSGP